jgi:hypothetical protein
MNLDIPGGRFLQVKGIHCAYELTLPMFLFCSLRFWLDISKEAHVRIALEDVLDQAGRRLLGIPYSVRACCPPYHTLVLAVIKKEHVTGQPIKLI